MDTIAKINETGKQGHDDALNALPGMQTAAGLLMTPSLERLGKYPYPLYADMNDTQRSVMDTYLQGNQPALDTLEHALAKPYYWRQYKPVPIKLGDTGAGMIGGNDRKNAVELASSLADQTMSNLTKYKRLAQALRYRVERSVVQGDADKALAEAVAIVRFAHLLSGPGMLVEQLVGTAFLGLGTNTVMYVVKEMDPNETLLARTYAELQGLFDWSRPWIDYSIEKAMVEDLIQRGFTDDGQGNGRALASGMFLLGDSRMDWWKNLLLIDLPNRKQVEAHIDRLFDEMHQDQIKTPWACRHQTASGNAKPLTKYGAMTEPALERVGELQWRAKIGTQAMLTVLAVKHYQAGHGVLPENFQEVVADGLLEASPGIFILTDR